MASLQKPTFELVAASDIVGLCPAIRQTADTCSELIFSSSAETLSEDALKQLGYQHPVHLLKHKSQYQIFAGLRTFQLLLCNDPNCTLPALVYAKASDDFLREMAATELLGSRLMHSLSTKPVTQISKIIAEIGELETERIAPSLKATRAITRSQKSRSEK
jgi:hypothetical protein